MFIVCVSLCAGTDVSAQIDETDPLPPLSAVDSLTTQLDRLQTRLERRPRDVGLRLSRLRVHYALSVVEEEHVERALSEIERIRVLGGAAVSSSLLEGYTGALRVVSGKHAFWPHQKLSRVKEGLELLDDCIAEEPHDVELRYLRLVSTFYLPFFFKRGDSAAADLKAVVSLLQKPDEAQPDDVLVPALDFVLQKADLDPELRARFTGMLEHARARMDHS